MLFEYHAVIVPNETVGFFAVVPDIIGCLAQGKTEEEALRNVKNAASEWINQNIQHKGEIPLPSTDDIANDRAEQIIDGLPLSSVEKNQKIYKTIKIEVQTLAK